MELSQFVLLIVILVLFPYNFYRLTQKRNRIFEEKLDKIYYNYYSLKNSVISLVDELKEKKDTKK